MKTSDLDQTLSQVAGILASIKANVTLAEIQLVLPLVPLFQTKDSAEGQLQAAGSLGSLLAQACTAGQALLTPRADGTLLIDVLLASIATVRARPLEEAAIALFL